MKFVTRQPGRAQAGRGARHRARAGLRRARAGRTCSRRAPRWRSSPRRGPSDDPKKFVWQRNGDLRYSFMHWVDRPQVQGPLGYGPSSPDPETGEIISATRVHLRRGAGHLRQVRGRQRAARQRPARHRRPAVGQDDQRRARRDGAGQPGAAGAEDDRRRARHGQGPHAGAGADARKAARSRSAPASTTSRWRRSRGPASRSCCSTTTSCPPSSPATAPATSRPPTCWTRR